MGADAQPADIAAELERFDTAFQLSPAEQHRRDAARTHATASDWHKIVGRSWFTSDTHMSTARSRGRKRSGLFTGRPSVVGPKIGFGWLMDGDVCL